VFTISYQSVMAVLVYIGEGAAVAS